jgi:hypothetical protein
LSIVAEFQIQYRQFLKEDGLVSEPPASPAGTDAHAPCG